MPDSTAVYPGSFDPLTYGHIDIIKRALPFFSTLHILIASNPNKKSMFTVDERLEMLREYTKSEKNIIASSFNGLLVDFARKVGAKAIIRGLRAVSDFDYEFQMATMNRRIAPDIETIFFTTRGKYFYVNSSTIKDLTSFGADVSDFVPKIVEDKIIEKTKGKVK